MKPLHKDIDISTMRRMRDEEHMSNSQIASALGCSYETVWRYLGKGPRKRPDNPRVKTTSTRKPASELFEVVNTEVRLESRKFIYRIYSEQQLMQVDPNGLLSALTFNSEELDNLIEELQYIRRTYMVG